jgi:hypothetical protein
LQRAKNRCRSLSRAWVKEAREKGIRRVESPLLCVEINHQYNYVVQTSIQEHDIMLDENRRGTDGIEKATIQYKDECIDSVFSFQCHFSVVSGHQVWWRDFCLFSVPSRCICIG